MIDILMSVRNGENYLRQSVESLLAQTKRDFTLYVIDDASVDKTAKILLSFKDSRIKIFRNTIRKGLTKNLNFLLEQGSGKYVARQDADDVSHPERLAKELNFLQKERLDLVGSNANLINQHGLRIGERTYYGLNVAQDLIKFNMFVHSSWFGKRLIFEQLCGYDENYVYAQDYDFLLRAIKKYQLGIVPEKLIDLRWDQRSVSLKHLKKQQLFALRAQVATIKRGNYAIINYIWLLKPFISYLLPAQINKAVYKMQ